MTLLPTYYPYEKIPGLSFCEKAGFFFSKCQESGTLVVEYEAFKRCRNGKNYDEVGTTNTVEKLYPSFLSAAAARGVKDKMSFNIFLGTSIHLSAFIQMRFELFNHFI